jgi:peroxin-6
MRHLEAFAQTTQAAEPGKGESWPLSLSPCMSQFFLDPAVVSVIKDLFQDLYGSWRLTGYPILVFGTTTEPGRVPQNLVSCFKHEVDFEVRMFLVFIV